MSEAHKIQTCVQCKAKSPEAEGQTLISAKYGWRLIRRADSEGNAILEWRCPPCAERYKKLRALAGMTSGFHHAVQIPTPTTPPKKDAK
jgi:hypothetical protein